MKIVLTAVAALAASLVTASGPTRALTAKSFDALSTDELTALADEVHRWRGTQAGQHAMQHGFMPSSAAQALASLGDMPPASNPHQAQSKLFIKLQPGVSKSTTQNATGASKNSSESVSDDPSMRELLKRYHDGVLRIAELAKVQPKAKFSMQTPFALMTPEEFQAYVDRGKPSLSTLISRHNTSTTTNDATVQSARKLRAMANPASKDWDAEGKVTSPRDQGSCNVCSVFAVVGAVESGYAIKAGYAVPSLSEQDVISCGPMQGSCMIGGQTEDTLNWLVNYNGGSLCTRDSFPYGGASGATVTCARYDDPSKACYKPDLGVVGYIVNEYSDHQRLESVVAVQPVAVIVNGSPSWFMHYIGGIIMGDENACPSDVSHFNHAVLIVGYGTSGDSTKFWKVKNSWSRSWGEQGFYRIERGYQGATYGACGIERLGIQPVFRADHPRSADQRCAPARMGYQTTGTILGTTFPVTNMACCDICRAKTGCVAVNFANSEAKCILLSSITGYLPTSGMSTIILRSTSESYAMCTAMESNVDYGGNDIMRLMTTSPGDCCDACMRNPSCTAYTWSQWNTGSCFLKTKRGSSITTHPPNGDGSSYYVSGEAFKCVSVTLNQDIPGQDLSNAPAANAYTCCGICRTTSGCAAFTWTDYNGGTCWLKTGDANATTKSGATSASIN